jgi:hypothetical protein
MDVDKMIEEEIRTLPEIAYQQITIHKGVFTGRFFPIAIGSAFTGWT